MTVTLIAFPDNMTRSDREFDRIGSTDFTRAVDEATSIYDDMRSGADYASLLQRIARLDHLVSWLESWRFDNCQDLISVGPSQMPLSLAPSFLRAAVGGIPSPRARPSLRIVK